jgi:hypothetical protein
VLKKFFNNFIGRGNESQLLPSTSALPKKSQREVDIEFATSIVKRYWTNDDLATEGMPGKKIDASWISQIEERLINQCTEIIDSEIPLMKNREFLSNSVISSANLQVLVLTKDTDTSGLINVNGISGELKEHLLKIIEVNKSHKEYFYGFSEKIDFDFAWSDILFRYRIRMSEMNVFSAMRILFNDTNLVKEKDWIQSFFIAMCIFSESNYRSEIGLPSLFPGNSLAALQYSIFLNMVINGEKYPDLSWREKYPNLELSNFQSN